MGRKVLLAVVFWLTLCEALGETEKNVNSVAKDNESAASARLYRNVPVYSPYASRAPYSSYSFHAPIVSSPPKLVKTESVIIPNAGFLNGLKDSYGKFVGPQTSYKTAFPQQYLQLQELPAHLAQPLLAGAPNYQYRQTAPQFYFGSQYRIPSLQQAATPTPITRFGSISQPVVYAENIRNIAPSSQYSQAYRFPPKHQNINANSQTFQRLQAQPQTHAVIDNRDAKGSHNENREIQASPAQTSVTAIVNGKKKVITLETKPPLPLLDLSLLEPLTFANPVVPQVQQFLPKISTATYHKLPEFTVKDANIYNKDIIVQNTKSYDSGLIKGKPQKVAPKTNQNIPKPQYKPAKPTVVVSGSKDGPEFSYEINTPNHKETYNEQVISYNKKTTMEPVTFSYNKKTHKEPETYTYSHSSKEPLQVTHVEYNSDEEPKQLVNTLNPEEQEEEQNDAAEDSGESEESSESDEEGPQLIVQQLYQGSPKPHNTKHHGHYGNSPRQPPLRHDHHESPRTSHESPLHPQHHAEHHASPRHPQHHSQHHESPRHPQHHSEHHESPRHQQNHESPRNSQHHSEHHESPKHHHQSVHGHHHSGHQESHRHPQHHSEHNESPRHSHHSEQNESPIHPHHSEPNESLRPPQHHSEYHESPRHQQNHESPRNSQHHSEQHESPRQHHQRVHGHHGDSPKQYHHSEEHHHESQSHYPQSQPYGDHRGHQEAPRQSHHLKPEHRQQEYQSTPVHDKVIYQSTPQYYSEPHIVTFQNAFQPITPEYEEDIRLLPTHKPFAEIRVDPNQHVQQRPTTPPQNLHLSAPQKVDQHESQRHAPSPTPHPRPHSSPAPHSSSAPHILEKSRRVIIQEETPDELHTHNMEQVLTEMIDQDENNEEDFEKAYKDSAFGFPAYEQNDDAERDIYNPEVYGAPRDHDVYNIEDAPFQQYQADGDEFPKSLRESYKDARDDNKEDYFLEYSAHKPESYQNRHKSKEDYYKMFKKNRPERILAFDNEDKKKDEKSEKFVAAPSFDFLVPLQKAKLKQYSAPYKTAPTKYEYDYSKETTYDNNAHASHPKRRYKTHFVEPQFQYGFEPIVAPLVVESELAAMASSDSPESEKPGTRKKVYKENWYIKKTSTSSKPS